MFVFKDRRESSKLACANGVKKAVHLSEQSCCSAHELKIWSVTMRKKKKADRRLAARMAANNPSAMLSDLKPKAMHPFTISGHSCQ